VCLCLFVFICSISGGWLPAEKRKSGKMAKQLSGFWLATKQPDSGWLPFLNASPYFSLALCINTQLKIIFSTRWQLIRRSPLHIHRCKWCLCTCGVREENAGKSGVKGEGLRSGWYQPLRLWQPLFNSVLVGAGICIG